jgi:phage terminase large subunit
MPTATVHHSFRPYGAAKTLFECRDAEVLLSGPAGTGKSRACLEKLHIVALKYPGMRGLIVRKTAVSLTSTALVTWNEHVVAEGKRHGLLNWYGGSQQEPAQYTYSNGSRVTVGGMDKATRIMSSEYDVIYVQEAIELTLDDWEALTTRLRHGTMPYQQIIAS